MSKAFEGKVALVTGANSGIGETAAVRLQEAGATVFGLARREDALAAARSRHPRVHWLLYGAGDPTGSSSRAWTIQHTRLITAPRSGGHGVEQDAMVFCCANCARAHGKGTCATGPRRGREGREPIHAVSTFANSAVDPLLALRAGALDDASDVLAPGLYALRILDVGDELGPATPRGDAVALFGSHLDSRRPGYT